MVKDPIINSYDNKELGRINFFEFIQSQGIVCSSIVDKDTPTSSSNSKLDEYKTFVQKSVLLQAQRSLGIVYLRQ